MAKPRRLNIPGEELPLVQHYFPGPHPFFRTRVLVVGGRNSALESALRCWRAGAQVTISYRRPAFDPELVRPHLLEHAMIRIKSGEIDFLGETIPVKITANYVNFVSTASKVIASHSRIKRDTDFVLLMTGYESDLGLLSRAGVALVGEEQAPTHNPQTMETNIPGIFVAGTVVGGTQRRLTHAIYTSHDQVAKIAKVISGRVPKRLGNGCFRNSDVSFIEK